MDRLPTETPDRTIYIGYKGGRESYYTLVGSPEALRYFGESLAASVEALPALFETSQKLRVNALETADADGSRKEVYLTIRAEPSSRWLTSQRNRTARKDVLVIFILIAIAVFAFIGFGVVAQWISNHINP